MKTNSCSRCGGRSPSGFLRIGTVLWSCTSATVRQEVTPRLVSEVRIGTKGGSEYALTQVADLAVDAQDAVFVLQSQERLVRVFDRYGRFVRTLGREGEGPGEFRRPLALGWRADTLWVWDAQLTRLNFFSRDGTFLRSLGLTVRGTAALTAVGALVEPFVYPGLGSGTPAPLLRLDDRGQVVDTMAQLTLGAGGGIIALPGFREGFGPFFGNKALWSVSPDGDAVFLVERKPAEQDSTAMFRVTKLSPGGDTVFSVAYGYQPVRIDDEILRCAVSDVVERFSRRGTSIPEHTLREMVANIAPAYLPPVTMIAPDRQGGLWIRREALCAGPAVWERVDAMGLKAPTLLAARNVRVLVANTEVAWGVETDQFDVPYVVRYRIQ